MFESRNGLTTEYTEHTECFARLPRTQVRGQVPGCEHAATARITQIPRRKLSISDFGPLAPHAGARTRTGLRARSNGTKHTKGTRKKNTVQQRTSVRWVGAVALNGLLRTRRKFSPANHANAANKTFETRIGATKHNRWVSSSMLPRPPHSLRKDAKEGAISSNRESDANTQQQC